MGIKVPRIEPNQEERGGQSLPNVKLGVDIPDEAFGGGPGAEKVRQATQRLGNNLTDFYSKQRSEANRTRMLEEKRALNDWEASRIYDPEKGAINRRGKDAFSLQEELDEDFNSFTAQREKSLINDEQKQAFREMAQGRRQEVLRWTQGHVGKQVEIYETEEYESFLESEKERGIVDPKNIPASASTIRNEVMLMGQKRGWGQERMNQELRKNETDLHGRYLTRLLSEKNGTAAKEYFESAKDRMDPDVVAKIKPAIDEVYRRAEGERLSQEYVSQYGTGAISKTDAIKDTELKDEVRQRIKGRIADQEYAKNVNQERIFEQAYNKLAQTRNMDDIAHMLPSVSPQQRKDLEAYLLKDPTATDREVYEEIKLGLANPETRSKYMQADLNQFRHRLSESDFQEIVKDKVALMKDDPKVKKKLDGFMSDSQTVDGLLTEADIKPKSDTGQKFKRKLDQLVEQHQDKTGKKVTNEELRRLGNTLLLEGVTHKGWIWDTTKRVYELENGQSFEEIEVPTEDAELIAKELKKRGRTVTQEAIVKYYIKGKTKGG